MRPVIITKELAAADDNGICESQTPTVAGSLDLDGDLVSGGVAQLDTQRRVLITSAGDDTGVTFTVTGTRENGVAITEDILGGDSVAVYTTQDFYTVSDVAVDDATAGAVIVGTNGVGSSAWNLPNIYNQPCNLSFGVVPGGTVNYTVNYTYDDPNSVSVPAVYSISALTSKTAQLDAAINDPIRAYRITVNSGTDPVTMTVIEAGISGQ